MTTQNNDRLTSFLEEVHNDGHLRVEADLGDGFVRLRTSEAERRQAAQDIQSTEDIVIEMLRNSRDSGASNIYLAMNREESTRMLVIIDDGCGIPEHMHESIFEPRVTSKLDTAHMDKWGMHGRGMALYSISVNAESACVVASEVGKGSSLKVQTDLKSLSEKSDQSTFPRFEEQESGSFAMRGPKNILRTAAEFALEHRRSCNVRCGSVAEIVASLYTDGVSALSPSQRAFGKVEDARSYAEMLAYASDPEELARLSASIGLDISERTSRRILDQEIEPLPTLLERIQSESFAKPKGKEQKGQSPLADTRGLKLTPEDAQHLKEAVANAFSVIAPRYYLESDVEPSVSVTGSCIKISIPVEKLL